MLEGFAPQYGTPCVVVELGDNEDGVLEYADEIGARCVGDGDPGDPEDFVVQFPGRPAELYTERALRSSITSMNK